MYGGSIESIRGDLRYQNASPMVIRYDQIQMAEISSSLSNHKYLKINDQSLTENKRGQTVLEHADQNFGKEANEPRL